MVEIGPGMEIWEATEENWDELIQGDYPNNSINILRGCFHAACRDPHSINEDVFFERMRPASFLTFTEYMFFHCGSSHWLAPDFTKLSPAFIEKVARLDALATHVRNLIYQRAPLNEIYQAFLGFEALGIELPKIPALEAEPTEAPQT